MACISNYFKFENNHQVSTELPLKLHFHGKSVDMERRMENLTIFVVKRKGIRAYR